MRVRNKFLFLTLTAFITACAGGNEVPNMVKGKVNNNSTSVSGAVVTVKSLGISATGADFGKTYTTKTNSSGDYEIEVEETGIYSITVTDEVSKKQTIESEIEITSTGKTVDLTLKETINLTGKISRNKIIDPKVLYAFIPGTNYKSETVDDNGFYRFKNIPQGKYPIAFTYGENGTIIKVETEKLISDSLFLKDLPFIDEIDSIQFNFNEYNSALAKLCYVEPIKYKNNEAPFWQKAVDFTGVKVLDIKKQTYVQLTNIDTSETIFKDSILIHDFEYSGYVDYTQNTFAAQIAKTNYPDKHSLAGGWLYIYSDSQNNNGGSSSISPDLGSYSDYSRLINSDENGISGKYLSIWFNITDQIQYPFAGLGFIIYGEASRYHDLSSMTKFTFWAKGNGRIRVKFFSDFVDNEMNDNGHFGKDIILTKNWSLYTILSSEIKPQSGSGAESSGKTWDDISNKINKIHFETTPDVPVNTSVQLHLDNLSIHGVSQQKLIDFSK